MKSSNKLSRLMKLSWDIQRNRHSTRSKAMTSAWAIMSNEDITVFYLTQRLNHSRPIKAKTLNQFALFAR